MAMMAWLQEQSRCYFNNAQAKRDFRTQLRGNRAIWLWSLYLSLLTIAATSSYGQITSGYGYGRPMEVYDMQQALKGLYGTMLTTITILITLIAPALTASAITTERQRRSLDLVFSAPVTPKYLLVGKMLGTYRYVWMLLVLSLPFTALAVVLGGATAWDVFTTYLSLSLVGLIYSAIGLLISSIAIRTGHAIFYSYLGVAGYLAVVTTALSILIYPTLHSATGSMRNPEWMNALLMFGGGLPVGMALGETPTLLSLVIFVALALFIVKLFMAGAGSALTARAGKETAALRIQSIILLLLTSIAAYIGTSGPMGLSSGMPVKYLELAFSILLVLVAFLPTLTCFGTDGANRSRNDGLFRVRTMFTGTPAGGLPFILLCVGIMLAPVLWIDNRDDVALALGFYIIGMWTFFWGIGRFYSGTLKGLLAAKAAHFVTMAALLVLPDTFAVISGSSAMENAISLWHPLFANSFEVSLGYGVVLALIGLFLALVQTGPGTSKAAPTVLTS